MSDLKARLSSAMKDAMRAKDKLTLGTIRMAQAAVKQKEIDDKVELDDTAVLAIITKLIKQREDAAQQYTDADRPDLAETERAEAAALKTFLPEQLSESAINSLIDEAIASTGAAGMADMGKVMGWLKPKVAGKADMGKLSGQIKSRLS